MFTVIYWIDLWLTNGPKPTVWETSLVGYEFLRYFNNTFFVSRLLMARLTTASKTIQVAKALSFPL